jgi:hypothetical protein
MNTKFLKVLLLAFVFCQVSSASAGLIHLSASIDGAQANAGAGTGSLATGNAALTYDDVSNLLSWEVDWNNLFGTLTVAHFHGPAAPGINAGVEVNFLGIAPGNPSIGSTNISSAQATDLLAGLWYVNIHTDSNPGGEIRGQIGLVNVPEPSTLAIFALGLIGLASRRFKKQS